MNIVSSCKGFYNKHYNKINKTITLVDKVSSEIVKVANQENRTPFSYIELGCKIREQVNSVFIDTNMFHGSEWQSINFSFSKIIVSIIEEHFNNKIVCLNKSEYFSLYMAYLGDVRVGWEVGWGGRPYAYFEKGKREATLAFLSEFLWNKMSANNYASLEIIETTFSSDVLLNLSNEFLPTGKSFLADKYLEHITKFQNEKMGRSIVFYGPPGTGKSNLVRYIAQNLNNRILKLDKLFKFNGKLILNIIELLKPSIIILEDIDHSWQGESSDLLDKLEDLNKDNRIVLATANAVQKIDKALLRPGRFDELIEITNSDIDVLNELIKDQEIAAKIKDIPIAFILEVAKRYKILGKEQTLLGLEEIIKRCKIYEGSDYKL